MAEIIPAILEHEFPEIERKIHLVENLVKWIQIDLADNTLVPNITFLDPTSFKGIKTTVNLELHLMVKNPLKYLDPFAASGFKRFYAHVEGEFVEEFIEEGLRLGVEVGLAIDGPTPFTAIHKYLDNIDGILVMAIDAGFSGRPFRDDTLEKIKQIRDIDAEIPICVDGAMDDVNSAKVIEAGATRINSNSYIFEEENVEEKIRTLASLGNLRSPV